MLVVGLRRAVPGRVRVHVRVGVAGRGAALGGRAGPAWTDAVRRHHRSGPKRPEIEKETTLMEVRWRRCASDVSRRDSRDSAARTGSRRPFQYLLHTFSREAARAALACRRVLYYHHQNRRASLHWNRCWKTTHLFYQNCYHRSLPTSYSQRVGRRTTPGAASSRRGAVTKTRTAATRRASVHNRKLARATAPASVDRDRPPGEIVNRRLRRT